MRPFPGNAINVSPPLANVAPTLMPEAVTQRGRRLHKIAATVARSSPEKSGHVHYEYFVVAASAGGWSESFTRLS